MARLASGRAASGGRPGGAGRATRVAECPAARVAGSPRWRGRAGRRRTPGTGGQGGRPTGPALAFPGAVGFGKVATGGRGKAVYHVTNLNDSGPGSFRDAVGTSGRIVVFDVGGYVVLSSAVSAKSNLTIAGQTAPGDGIGIMAREVSFNGATNDIVRYVRFRQGDLDPDSKKSGINLLDASNMIFDHVSIQFAQWNNIDAVGATNITVQNSIDANPIGQQFAAHTETGPYTWYRNLFANAHNRNPLAKANTEYINNVIYDFQLGYTAGNTAGTFSHDLVNNYFITGPATTNASDALFQVDHQPIYNAGNLLDANGDGVLNGSPLASPAVDGRAVVAVGAEYGQHPHGLGGRRVCQRACRRGRVAAPRSDRHDGRRGRSIVRQDGQPLDAPDGHQARQQRLRDADRRDAAAGRGRRRDAGRVGNAIRSEPARRLRRHRRLRPQRLHEHREVHQRPGRRLVPLACAQRVTSTTSSSRKLPT